MSHPLHTARIIDLNIQRLCREAQSAAKAGDADTACHKLWLAMQACHRRRTIDTYDAHAHERMYP